MFASIVGIQYVKNGAFVHCVAKSSFTNNDGSDGGLKVEKVYVKFDSYVYAKIAVGVECYISYDKVGNKYYTNLKI